MWQNQAAIALGRLKAPVQSGMPLLSPQAGGMSGERNDQLNLGQMKTVYLINNQEPDCT